jgi:hypothetical protein
MPGKEFDPASAKKDQLVPAGEITELCRSSIQRTSNSRLLVTDRTENAERSETLSLKAEEQGK